MERTNIYLDDETKQAAAYLKDMHGITTVSEAIRWAVRDSARRGGWRSAVEQGQPKRRRATSAARRQPDEGG